MFLFRGWQKVCYQHYIWDEQVEFRRVPSSRKTKWLIAKLVSRETLLQLGVCQHGDIVVHVSSRHAISASSWH
jgi:hypothetical protein